MSRSASRPATLRNLIERGVLPADTDIGRAGLASWQGDDFYNVLSLDAHGGGWDLWIGDHRFRALEAAGYGGVKVKVQSAGDGQIGWVANPEAFASQLVEGISFVHDREDLCEILMCPETLVIGSVEVWQMIGNYPARLAQALLVSRDLGREDLEVKVRVALENAPAANAFGKQVAAAESARRWLKEYTKVVGSDVHL